MDIKDIARVCHNVNKALCEAAGDMSQKDWKDADQWQRKSAVQGVKHMHSNPNATPAEMHAKWMQDKEAEGWVFGEAKDVEKKTHPCIRPYDELPAKQRVKDFVFAAICRELM